MNITFLVGNGFDLNLGLETKYEQFLASYTADIIGNSDLIKRFKKDILKNFPEWSSAESAFGKYTEQFLEGEGNLFAECHEDFCEKLASYLTKQENSLNFDENNIGQLFYEDISEFYRGFRESQTNQIKHSISKVGYGFHYNFITFNYTTVLDKIVAIAKKIDLGKRSYNGSTYSNDFRELRHVHGYTNKDMVLGLNDEEQILNKSIFDGLPEEYLSQIIKIKTNMMLEQNNDSKTLDVLKSSDIIYIYGMSIGETDKLWWTRIYDVMKEKHNLHVIIHDFDGPKDSLIQTRILLYENQKKNNFLRFSEFDDDIKKDFFDRIHIDRTNIFENLKDFAIISKADDLETA